MKDFFPCNLNRIYLPNLNCFSTKRTGIVTWSGSAFLTFFFFVMICDSMTQLFQTVIFFMFKFSLFMKTRETSLNVTEEILNIYIN